MEKAYTQNCALSWDLERRRIHIVYTGHVVNADEIADVGAAFREPLDALAGGDGFDLVTVFTSALGPLSDIEIRQVTALYGPLRQLGLRILARVIEADCVTDTSVIDQAARETGIELVLFGTIDEADRHLDARPVRGGESRSDAAAGDV